LGWASPVEDKRISCYDRHSEHSMAEWAGAFDAVLDDLIRSDNSILFKHEQSGKSPNQFISMPVLTRKETGAACCKCISAISTSSDPV
jgi:hypothetical protein